MIVRPAEPRDDAALAEIYGHAVLHGFGTFETEPPTPDEMTLRRTNIQGRGLPYLVAEDEGRVLGFAYAGPFRPRHAYRYTVEDSVYVAPDAAGKGVGRAVLSAVLEACEALGVRQVVAIVGDSQNAGSIRLHRALGFEDVGVSKSLGFKHGRWVDIVHMQKALNGGAASEPVGPGVKVG